MSRIYRTPTDKRLQDVNNRLRRKARYYQKKHGITLNVPITSPVGLTGSQKLAAIRRGEQAMRKQYVAGADNVPLDRATYNRYRNAERQLNKRNVKRRSELGTMPYSKRGSMKMRDWVTMKYGGEGGTIAQFIGARMQKPGPYAPRERPAKAFASPEGLDAILADTRKRLSPKFIADTDRRLRKSIKEMLRGTEDAHLIKAINKMSKKQRDVLFNLTPFMDSVSYLNDSDGRREDENEAVIQLAQSRASEIVDIVLANVK